MSKHAPTAGTRTVHVTIPTATGLPIEIVRYANAGWWLEPPLATGLRRRISVHDAAGHALRPGAVWHEGRPGGRALDQRVRLLRSSRTVHYGASSSAG